jgi:HAE1 family hydrophobic/amphiphilic exporter-1
LPPKQKTPPPADSLAGISLAKVSIERPVFAWMLFAAALIFGAIGWGRLGLSQLPDVDFPVVTVNFTLLGASPEVMENNVIDLAEQALIAVEGVKEISSTSGQGTGSITLEFDLGKDMSAIVQDVNAKLSSIAKTLPSDMDPPQVSKTNPEDQPIIWFALTQPKGAPTKDMMLLVRDRLRDEFQTVPGVAEIQLGGWVDRNLRIWLDSRKMENLQIAADDVLNTVDREHLEVPAGRIEMPASELNVRFLGEAPSVKAFGDLPITSRGGATIYRRIRMRDVSTIEDGLDDVRRLSRFDGEPAVGIGIKKQRGVNAVEVGRAAKAKALQINKTLPPGYKLTVSVDNTIFVEHAVHELEQTLCLAAALTGIVCWAFLGSWSSTVNVLMSIPFSIIGTFLVVYAFGFTLNTFTLLSLSLAVGVVVDDAIMVLENIVRHKEMGKDKRHASLDGATEITFAAMAATFSIIAIFLPVAFMQGIIGRYFFQFGITISAAAFLSLIEALTLTPMRTSQFLEEHSHAERGIDRLFGRLKAAYERGLAATLRHRGLVLFGALAIFGLGFAANTRLKGELIPAQDQSRLLARLSLPTGTSMQTTDEMMKQAEAWVASRGETLHLYSVVGGFGGGDVSTGIIFMTMKDPGERPVVEEDLAQPGAPKPKPGEKAPTIHVKKRLAQSEFAQIMRRELGKLAPNLRVSIQDLSQRGFSTGRGFPVEFTVRGPDWDVLADASEKLRNAMRQDAKLADVDSDYLTGQQEIRVIPDRDAAARRGVSMQSLGGIISTLVGGTRAGKFSEGGKRNDIRVRLQGGERADAKDILKLKVRNNHGELVGLGEVVKLDTQPSLQSIHRVHRERAITLYANAGPGVAGGEALAEALKLAKDILPPGYRAVPTGSSQAGNEAALQLFGALILGIAVAYMILASQFNSFIDPVTVILAMPLSFTGAFIALLAFGQTLNLYSGIGLILLMGLVKKNSILLVDVTNQHKAAGQLKADQALLEACPLRLRPIVMTSVATIAGAVPAAASLGAGSETLRPMGIAIIGGILLSTFLTLFVVPAAYSFFEELGEWLEHWWTSRKKAPLAPVLAPTRTGKPLPTRKRPR